VGGFKGADDAGEYVPLKLFVDKLTGLDAVLLELFDDDDDNADDIALIGLKDEVKPLKKFIIYIYMMLLL